MARIGFSRVMWSTTRALPAFEASATPRPSSWCIRSCWVTDDHVQSAVTLGIGVWLIASVDRAAPCGRRRDTFPDVFGSLANAGMAPRAVWRSSRHPHRSAGSPRMGSGPRCRTQGRRGDWCSSSRGSVAVASRVGVVLEEVDVAVHAFIAKRCSAPVSSCSRSAPALSWTTSSRTLSHSGVAYSGWLPTSRYSRAPLPRKTLLLRPQETTRRNR